MNWYKIAISEQDFYKFYALEGLSDEEYKQNPVFLYDLIEHLNYIREYYLSYLYQQIAKELQHSYGDPEYALSWGSSGGSRYDDEYEDEYEDDYGDDYGDDEPVYLDHVLEERAVAVVTKFINKKISKTLFNEAIYLFEEIPWSKFYGGKAWALITKWTLKLWQIEEISQQEFNPSVIKKIRELIFIIDTIHSIAHNTNIVLINLPEGESRWLPLALEVVKNAKSYLNLAQLSGNMKIKEYYRREKMPLEQERAEENISINTYKVGWEEILERYAQFIEEGSKDGSDRLRWIIENMLQYTINPNIINSFLEIIKEKIITEEAHVEYFDTWSKFWLKIFRSLSSNFETYNSDALDNIFYILRKLYYDGKHAIVKDHIIKMARMMKGYTARIDTSVSEWAKNKIMDFIQSLNDKDILSVYENVMGEEFF